MSYPIPMDVAEAEDRAADALDAALDWPYSREVWDQIDAERLELLAANDALAELYANRGEALLRETDMTQAALRKQWEAESQLADVLAWLQDPCMKQWSYMESGDFYGDLANHISAIEKILGGNATHGAKINTPK